MADTTVLVNTGAVLSQTFTTDEATIDADGTVTVTVTNLAGGSVSGPATATHVGAAGSGLYEWPLAPQAAPDVLRVVWSGTFGGVAQSLESSVEIVGGQYFTLYALRHADDQHSATPPLADANKWPNDLLRAARLEAEKEAMRIMGHSCVPRAARERMVARRGVLHPSKAYVREIRAVTLASDASTVDFSAWSIEGATSSWIRCGLADGTAVIVVYEHGEDRVESDVSRACVVRARHALARYASQLPETTDRFQQIDGGGTLFLSQPTAKSTGNSYVDAVYGPHSTQVGFA